MKRRGLVVTLILGVLVFALAFGAVTEALALTQPVAPGNTARVAFVVQQGDTATQIAERLQREGLIQNALAFRVLARVRNLDRGIKFGVYQLSPAMTMDQIIQVLLSGAPGQQLTILVPPGMRIAQYPALFSQLPAFNAQQFVQIATTGKYPDGTTVASKFWYVAPPQPNAKYALEGYLFPDTYDFSLADTASAVINRMLTGLGEHLCPGPSNQPDAYLGSETTCTAHAAALQSVVGKHVTIFSALEQRYFTTNDVLALYRALTIASIVMREVSKSQPDIIKVTDLYYNRYLVYLGKLPEPNSSDVVNFLGADPTAQYARDTDTPPANGKYWQPLQNAASQTDPNNLYNTNNASHKGLPPGPISAPFWFHIAAAAYPNAAGPTPYFYFLSSNGTEYYATTFAQFCQLNQQYLHQSC